MIICFLALRDTLCFLLNRKLCVRIGGLSCPEKVVVEGLVCIQPKIKGKSRLGLTNFTFTSGGAKRRFKQQDRHKGPSGFRVRTAVRYK
jgi:hypothetical protein